MPRLISLSYSPWSEKARWALAHHAITHARTEYVPMLGEPVLRFITNDVSGRVTVPVYLDEDLVLTDSLEIARHADRRGNAASLFRDADLPAIIAWNERSEAIMSAGRALVIPRIADDPAAQREGLPGFIPAAMRSMMLPVASMAVRYLQGKYRLTAPEIEQHEATMRAGLTDLRNALGSEPRFLLGGFSYADIAMATAMQVVRPVDDRFIRLGPATRALWTRPRLAEEFEDLLAWRDRMYANHRTPTGARA